MRSYKHGILGGTFDHFHIGHQKLIDTAFNHSEKVTIGVTQPSMYQHKLHARHIETFLERKNSVVTYVKARRWLDRATIISINDIYGDSLNSKFDAIFATHTNLPNVRLINQKRKEQKLHPLKVILVPTVLGDDKRAVTSQRIRLGEIDRNGHSYRRVFDEKRLFKLPENMREEMRKPLGDVYNTIKNVNLADKHIVIAVGDIVALTLLQLGITPAISIIDGKTRRQALLSDEKNILLHSSHAIQRFNNNAGTIHTRVVAGYRKAVKNYLLTRQSQLIAVNGEEDLLALPAILLAPLGAIVLYGQFDLGVVANRVTKDEKMSIEKILQKFTSA